MRAASPAANLKVVLLGEGEKSCLVLSAPRNLGLSLSDTSFFEMHLRPGKNSSSSRSQG